MDEYTRKRTNGVLGLSKNGSSLALRYPNHDSKGIQYCNRLGCSTRLNSMKGTQISSPEKTKYPKASFRSTSSKFVVGSSSKTFSSPTDARKSLHEKQVRLPFRDTTESSSRQVEEDVKFSSQLVEPEASELIPVTTTVKTTIPPESEGLESPNLQGLSMNQNKATTSRSLKQIHRRPGSSSQGTPRPCSSSSVGRPVASRTKDQLTRPCLQNLTSGPPRYGLKNLSCSSISDILPPGCSSSSISHSRKVTSVRKRPSDGETSSSGGKSKIGSPTTCFPGSSASLMPQQALRKAKGQPTSKDGPVSVRTRRAPVGESRIRLSEQQNDNSIVISEPILYPQLPQSQLSILESVPESSSRSFPLEAPLVFHNSLGGRPSSSSHSARSRLLSSHSADSSIRGTLGDRNGYQHFNMDGIAEVLLALERIEQEDELTYEQLMVLETNLLLGGFSFHDQHRDMRLDIDNMTYEELLALEEKMGTVSTALSEDALSECLKRNKYMPSSHFPRINSCGHDDTKCSICQEEYVAGEEVGKLACDHRYHVDCIYQWLRQKNWCPICKTSASSPSEERNGLKCVTKSPDTFK